MRTQVGIIGAGPAGLMLSHLLHLQGIESIVLEAKSRANAEARVRAGVLESGTANLLIESGVGERLLREGLRHEGIVLRHNGGDTRLDFPRLTGGHSVVIYGQQEIIKDLIRTRLEASGRILFEAESTCLGGVESNTPSITFRHAGSIETLHCDFIAGCDGFHGISRAAIGNKLTCYERKYPFAWLGVLAQAAPASQELIYARHERGFALHSMRSQSVSRFYLQVPVTENSHTWPDERIWTELEWRLATQEGFRLERGPILKESYAPAEFCG